MLEIIQPTLEELFQLIVIAFIQFSIVFAIILQWFKNKKR